MDGVTAGIERMSGGQRRLVPIPVRASNRSIFGQRRWHSTDFQKNKAYEFEDVCKYLVTNPSTSQWLHVQY
jgi:hypothetical protein